jgi:parallel beta-helix repeat protein
MPANNSVEASIYECGINYENAGYIRISHISFRHQQIDGVRAFIKNTNISIQQCHFNAIYSKAVNIYGADSATVKNTDIMDVLGGGIKAWECKNIIIQNNTVKRISLYAGRAAKDTGTHNAIDMLGHVISGNISSNTLDNLGYTGLRFSKNTLIEKNVISNYCLTADDGGAMYTNGTYSGLPRDGTGCVIRNNIIQNGIGNLQATTDKWAGAVGIYMDDSSGNALIQDNTVMNCSSSGIYLHNSNKNRIKGNTIFNCGDAALMMRQDGYSPIPIARNLVENNYLYSVDENSFSLMLMNWEDKNLNFATYTGNYYCSPYNDICIYTETRISNATNYYTVNQWKALKDPGAKSSHVRWNAYSVIDVIGDNLIVNGDFNTNLDGWWCWSPTNSCVSSWGINDQLDQGSWHLQGQDGCAFNQNYYFGLEAKQAYQLSFSTVAAAPGTLAVQTADANSWARLELDKNVPVDSVRKDHRIIFIPTYATNPVRIVYSPCQKTPGF